MLYKLVNNMGFNRRRGANYPDNNLYKVIFLEYLLSHLQESLTIVTLFNVTMLDFVINISNHRTIQDGFQDVVIS